MTLLPKPVHAEKRAVRPLRRGPKRKKPPNRKRKTSRGAQGRLADKLFSLIVRVQGICRYHGVDGAADPWGGGCKGGLQCAHVVSRSYRSVRWDEKNAMPLCAAAHTYFTHHPLEWETFVAGPPEQGFVMSVYDYMALKRKALVKWNGDLEGVLVRLAARAVALGIEAR